MRITKIMPFADARAGLISVDPERHSGTPCFAGTRVPIRDLFDFVEGGESLEAFLVSFPTVSREQAIEVLRLAGGRMLPLVPQLLALLPKVQPGQVNHVEWKVGGGSATVGPCFLT